MPNKNRKSQRERFAQFKERLRRLGWIATYDRRWRGVFALYGWPWPEWWDDCCDDSEYPLTGPQSIRLDDEGQEHLLWWLFTGDEAEAVEMYRSFSAGMDMRKEAGWRGGLRPSQPLPPPKPIPSMPGYVYVIGAAGRFKIGRGINIKSRIQQHETSSPFEIEPILQIKVSNCVTAEKALHERFRPKHAKGEWFMLDKADLTAIREYLEGEAVNE